MVDFVTAVKSTIDKHAVDVAKALGISEFIDYDDTVKAAEILKSDNPAVIWQMLFLDEDPIHPLYKVGISIGAKTVNDAGNYDLLKIVDALRQVFSQNTSIFIYDYTAAVDPENPASLEALGYMFINGVDVQGHQQGQQMGARFATINAKIQAF